MLTAWNSLIFPQYLHLIQVGRSAADTVTSFQILLFCFCSSTYIIPDLDVARNLNLHPCFYHHHSVLTSEDENDAKTAE